MNKKTIWAVVIIIVIIAVIAGLKPNKKPQISERMTIGIAAALTGDAAEWGEAEKNGINLALKENSDLDAVFEDTKSSSQGSVTAVQKLVNFDNLTNVIGPTWLDSYPGAQGVIKDKHVV